VRFERIETDAAVGTVPRYEGARITPPLILRVYRRCAEESNKRSPSETPLAYVDVPWNG